MSAYCSMPSVISLIGRPPPPWPRPSFATYGVVTKVLTPKVG